MSGLPNLPQQKTSTAAAIWTCLICNFLRPKIDRKIDLFLVHLIHADYLKILCEICDYKLPPEYDENYQRFCILSTLL